MFEDRRLENGFTLGLFRPEDAPGIADCYRAIYGEGFPMRYVYDHGAITEKNTKGGQYTLVVRDGHGQIAGLIGLCPQDQGAGVYESAQLMVREEFRDLKLGRILVNAGLQELPVAIGARAIFVEAVCSSTVSQALASKCGLKPTGLELECLPARDKTRTSLLYMFKVFDNQIQTLFAPGRYADFIRTCCSRMGLERYFDQANTSLESETEMETEELAFASLARCRVRRIGQDFIKQVTSLIRDFPGWIFQIQVSLADPAAGFAIDALRENGFFLGAYLPGWTGADAMMFQRVAQKPQAENIRLMPGAAEEVFQAVMADMPALYKDKSR